MNWTFLELGIINTDLLLINGFKLGYFFFEKRNFLQQNSVIIVEFLYFLGFICQTLSYVVTSHSDLVLFDKIFHKVFIRLAQFLPNDVSLDESIFLFVFLDEQLEFLFEKIGFLFGHVKVVLYFLDWDLVVHFHVFHLRKSFEFVYLYFWFEVLKLGTKGAVVIP